MTSTRCFRCGRVNSNGSTACDGCGEGLLWGQEYESRLQELRDYEDLRKRYSLLGIVLAIVLLMLACPAVDWLIGLLLPSAAAGSLAAVAVEYAAPAVVLLALLMVVFPMVLGRLRIKRKYRWTRERTQSLDREIKSLPNGFLKADMQAGEVSDDAVKKMHGPPALLLLTVFAAVALVSVAKYTDISLDSVTSLVGIENAVTVEGEYERHFEAEVLGEGLVQSDQTWRYSFNSDGTYTTYLDGYQQYSGTWSQSGTALTVDVPEVPGISAAYTFEATVSRDGSSFTAGGTEFTKVR